MPRQITLQRSFSRGIFLLFFTDIAISPFQIVVLVERKIEGKA